MRQHLLKSLGLGRLGIGRRVWVLPRRPRLLIQSGLILAARAAGRLAARAAATVRST
jgi:hypothetical protein